MSTLVVVILVFFMLVGIVGSLLPLIPGNLLIGLSILLYAWYDGLETISLFATTILVLLSIAAGTADFWLPLVGAKTGGASLKTILFGLGGAIIGFIAGSVIPVFGSLIGSLAGYVGGIMLSAYQEHKDWNLALKASLSGLAGWGLATVLQVVVAIITFVAFLMIAFGS